MTKTVSHGDVELATQAFGDPADPPVLLIMGARSRESHLCHASLDWPRMIDEIAAHSAAE